MTAEKTDKLAAETWDLNRGGGAMSGCPMLNDREPVARVLTRDRSCEFCGGSRNGRASHATSRGASSGP